MDIKGRVVNIVFPGSAVPGSFGETKNNGEKWKKHVVVIEYAGGDYPKRLAATVFSRESANRWEAFNIQMNKLYNFSIDIDAREWNGRWFNDLSIWKVTPVADENAGTAAQALMSNAVNMVAAKFPPEQPVQQPQPIQQPAEQLPF